MLHKTIFIWEGTDFIYKGNDDFVPTMDTYILEGDKKRPSILICPGGGYAFTSPREAEPIALQFNAAGFHAFVLYYSVAPARHPQPLMDLSRAMCILRYHAEEWKIDPDRIGVCGFSAGGHLAASLGVHWNRAYLEGIPGIKMGMNRPNALILSYPVITSGQYAHEGSIKNLLGEDVSDPKLLQEVSLEFHIHKETPPTFLWHTFNDAAVPLENTMLFAQGLREKDVPFELHIYPHGPHGLSLANEETDSGAMGSYPHVSTWMELCIGWLKEFAFA